MYISNIRVNSEIVKTFSEFGEKVLPGKLSRSTQEKAFLCGGGVGVLDRGY